jgi:predicted peptidase
MNATFVPKNIQIAPHFNGFWEYLPASYLTNPEKRYPVMQFHAGIGEWGNGLVDDAVRGLPIILRNGLPSYISKGLFPDITLGLDGEEYEFIIICPQVNTDGYRNTAELNTIWTYITNNYRVDTTRLYLTGLSFGGGTCESYASSLVNAQKIAAMAAVCGNRGWSQSSVDNMIEASLPTAFFHNDQDPTVPYATSVNWVNHLNENVPPINPQAILHTNHSASHNAWTNAYNPLGKFSEFQGNLYQWLLSHTR